ncbi:DUF721 domain-containing protein [Limibaculum sp. FT325]|uniref:DUF721 domain-containing protein n=1 Tax=Thermohalobaculum sediminis TaxID=2939436 RepID=UPI0020BEBF7F|nr:DciA family protein [Limibaculum sediminis]MCL5776369.1 DUF721 domain-containing protein [Limibaculum sediminis]
MAASDPGGKGGGREPAPRCQCFRAAGAAARARVVPLAGRQGFAEAAVLLHWPEIVGAAWAGLCHPVKVTYGRGAELGATLMVRADGPAALELEHRAPQIVERINAHYGYRAIARLRITQGSGLAGESRVGFAEDPAAFAGAVSAAPGAKPAANPWRGEARAPVPVTAEARARAAEMAEGLRNPELRDALARMGAFVLSRPKPPE